MLEIGIGILAYFWGVASGFATDEIQEIVAAEQKAATEPGMRYEGAPSVGP